MKNSELVQHINAFDPTWERAHQLVDQHINIPYQVWNFFRGAWNGSINHKEFLKMLGFSKLSANSLIIATDNKEGNISYDFPSVEKSLNYLGIRFATVILAINYFNKQILLENPKTAWSELLQEMIDIVEIGYKFGSKVHTLGSEGGTLMGFANIVPFFIFNIINSAKLNEIFSASTHKEAASIEVKEFGCERYQIACFIIQKLGFGPNTALGVALALSNSNKNLLEMDNKHEAWLWKSSLLWIDALYDGRGYPADLDARNYFKELVPPKDKQSKNTYLEVLYTEIAKVRSQGSSWQWHL